MHEITYLLLGPRQLALELLLLVEEDSVLDAESRETFCNLLGELHGVLLRPLDHDEEKQAHGTERKQARVERPARMTRQAQ